ncbi:hypothetical protein GUITHDRAFT_104989 [Guillardia theta CCMP2712]|uniref:Rab-GAP TBC domain-containing protein n=1 Tax=Guillardia theta (strain CCMP2712) TaxID=905079 RepID=L1JLN7_GUITC|nr:hypothetical protein GUITHDRAFT_104989 [Guillardia theta CCMP2712]EKX49461.1 hypothetical protein GUITHDRAFT_104989 [Guillardia theta CCMP2712]|eukprot:XP_005836441.1 hypothetical protein GUITHDRAFT_104989 [Guillardia theta CCMP2712]
MAAALRRVEAPPSAALMALRLDSSHRGSHRRPLIAGIKFTQSGERCIMYDSTGKVFRLNVEKNEWTYLLHAGPKIKSVSLSHEKIPKVAICTGEQVQVFCSETGECLSMFKIAHGGEGREVLFLSNHMEILVFSQSSLHLLSIRTRAATQRTFKVGGQRLSSILAIHLFRHLLLVCTAEGLYAYSPTNLELPLAACQGEFALSSSCVSSGFFAGSPRGSRAIQVWRVNGSGEEGAAMERQPNVYLPSPVDSLQGIQGSARCPRSHPLHDSIVVWSADRALQFVSLPTGTMILVVDLACSSLTCLVAHWRTFAALDKEGAVSFFDLPGLRRMYCAGAGMGSRDDSERRSREAALTGQHGHAAAKRRRHGGGEDEEERGECSWCAISNDGGQLEGGEWKAKRKELQGVLARCKEFPSERRRKVWSFLLQLPGSRRQQQLLLKQDAVRMAQITWKEQDSEDRDLSSPLSQRAWKVYNGVSCWCKLFAFVPEVILLVRSFCRIFKDDGFALELVIFFLLNRGGDWFRQWPLLPSYDLQCVLRLLERSDPFLWTRLKTYGEQVATLTWRMLCTACCDHMTSSQWGLVLDHVLSRRHFFLHCLVVAVYQGFRSLLSATVDFHLVEGMRRFKVGSVEQLLEDAMKVERLCEGLDDVLLDELKAREEEREEEILGSHLYPPFTNFSQSAVDYREQHVGYLQDGKEIMRRLQEREEEEERRQRKMVQQMCRAMETSRDEHERRIRQYEAAIDDLSSDIKRTQRQSSELMWKRLHNAKRSAELLDRQRLQQEKAKERMDQIARGWEDIAALDQEGMKRREGQRDLERKTVEVNMKQQERLEEELARSARIEIHVEREARRQVRELKKINFDSRSHVEHLQDRNTEESARRSDMFQLMNAVADVTREMQRRKEDVDDLVHTESEETLNRMRQVFRQIKASYHKARQRDLLPHEAPPRRLRHEEFASSLPPDRPGGRRRDRRLVGEEAGKFKSDGRQEEAAGGARASQPHQEQEKDSTCPSRSRVNGEQGAGASARLAASHEEHAGRLLGKNPPARRPDSVMEEEDVYHSHQTRRHSHRAGAGAGGGAKQQSGQQGYWQMRAALAGVNLKLDFPARDMVDRSCESSGEKLLEDWTMSSSKTLLTSGDLLEGSSFVSSSIGPVDSEGMRCRDEQQDCGIDVVKFEDSQRSFL